MKEIKSMIEEDWKKDSGDNPDAELTWIVFYETSFELLDSFNSPRLLCALSLSLCVCWISAVCVAILCHSSLLITQFFSAP